MTLLLIFACSNAPSDVVTDPPVPTPTEPFPTPVNPPCEEAPGCEGGVAEADGFWRCPDGSLNRRCAEAIDPRTDAGLPDDAACDGGCSGLQVCFHPECLYTPQCSDACSVDADCGSGFACLPAWVQGSQTVNTCTPATCLTNADCPSGECGFFADEDWYSGTLSCRPEQPECRVAADCPERPDEAEYEPVCRESTCGNRCPGCE